MEARELRIGNWVYLEREDIYETISAIDFALLVKNPLLFDNYKPIPLTNEWMLKFGFTLVDVHGWKFPKYEFSITQNKKGEFILEFCSVCCCFTVARFMYVDELQNLIFALTGEELTIE